MLCIVITFTIFLLVISLTMIYFLDPFSFFNNIKEKDLQLLIDSNSLNTVSSSTTKKFNSFTIPSEAVIPVIISVYFFFSIFIY